MASRNDSTSPVNITKEQVLEYLEDADRFGWVSPEANIIRFLADRSGLTRDREPYLSGYRAGWRDACDLIVSNIESTINEYRNNHGK